MLLKALRKQKEGWKKKRTSSDDDVSLEVVTLRHHKLNLNFPTLHIRGVVFHTLRLPCSGPLAVVVLGVDDDPSLLVGEVWDDVTPPFVVVDTQGDNELFAIAGLEAKGTGRAAATHSEHLGTVRLGPGSTVGKLPNGLLNNVEKGVGVGLVDTGLDSVRHSMQIVVSSWVSVTRED